ncbi:MAG: YerC/YecD family TrpR-related protein [Actinomycetia bacterium]|nr:YerC/YecD family TrpR-related protein [Actinomycetes bacterium]
MIAQYDTGGPNVPTLTDNQWADSDDAASLVEAVITLNTTDQAMRFLRDLCTRRELEEMVSRWAVVRRLATGTSYRAIHEDTGVSTATITRINDWVRNGTGGYDEAMTRIGEKGPS